MRPLALAALSLLAATGPTHTLTVHVSTFKPVQGALFCRVFSSPDGFPGKPPFAAETKVPVTAPQATCTFPGLASGTYAVAVFHDENGNGKLDTNFLGIPSEGVGVSGGHFRSFGPPTFEDNRFTLDADKTIEIALRY